MDHVSCSQSGLQLLDILPTLYEKSPNIHGQWHCGHNTNFSKLVRIASCSSVEVILLKNMRLGHVIPAPSVEHIDLSELTPALCTVVHSMLKLFASIWEGKQGECKVTEHRIEILPGASPVFSQPYRPGLESRKIIQENVDRLLQRDLIEPTKS